MTICLNGSFVRGITEPGKVKALAQCPVASSWQDRHTAADWPQRWPSLRAAGISQHHQSLTASLGWGVPQLTSE